MQIQQTPKTVVYTRDERGRIVYENYCVCCQVLYMDRPTRGNLCKTCSDRLDNKQKNRNIIAQYGTGKTLFEMAFNKAIEGLTCDDMDMVKEARRELKEMSRRLNNLLTGDLIGFNPQWEN